MSQAWTTIEDMSTMGHKPNESTIHCFLSACLKQSQGHYATAVFQMAQAHGMTFSQSTYALLMKLQGSCGQVQEALAVYELMTVKQGIDPTPETQVTIMRVCFQSRWPEKAFELFEQAKKYASPRSPVDARVYKAAICGAASAGLVPMGIAFVEEGLKGGVTVPADAIEFLANAAYKRSPNEAKKLQQLAKAYGYSV